MNYSKLGTELQSILQTDITDIELKIMAHVFLKVLPYENKIPKKSEVIRFWLCANSNMAV